MDANRTLLDDLSGDEFPLPSTSTFTDESSPARDLLIGEVPETDPNNVTGIIAVNTTAIRTHNPFEDAFKTIGSLTFLALIDGVCEAEKREWDRFESKSGTYSPGRFEIIASTRCHGSILVEGEHR